MTVSEDFTSAIQIYKNLLEEGFPQKAILKLVGDRYRLSSVERTMLYRGVSTDNNSSFRKAKLALVKNIKNNSLHIDTYNVLITIGSYLNGSLVFIGSDNFLRDAAEIHGKAFRNEFFYRAIVMIFDYLKIHKVSETHFYLDSPVSNSGKLSSKINECIIINKISGSAQTVNSPDFVLKEIREGIISTSDSNIIDNCNVPVFDLARRVLTFKFKPSLLRICS